MWSAVSVAVLQIETLKWRNIRQKLVTNYSNFIYQEICSTTQQLSMTYGFQFDLRFQRFLIYKYKRSHSLIHRQLRERVYRINHAVDGRISSDRLCPSVWFQRLREWWRSQHNCLWRQQQYLWLKNLFIIFIINTILNASWSAVWLFTRFSEKKFLIKNENNNNLGIEYLF